MHSAKYASWKDAMCEELKALEANSVWELIKRPEKVNALHTKWAFRTTTDANSDMVQGATGRVWKRAGIGSDFCSSYGHVDGEGDTGTNCDMESNYKARGYSERLCQGKEEHLDFYLQVPQGMAVSDKMLKEHDARGKSDLVYGYARAYTD
ncbi:unnamed protein product [Peronospora belbahrii]|uniref:Reverse transcriptase Ty1/copia-type domain-containing protein n=1 Tax=Peronospora belbahrii TaxID=622444 RepID=A0AAU9LCE4_9STRA|nr:unnamed protein product [Peronospora belbahrii]